MKANRTLLIMGVAASIGVTAVALTLSKAMAQPWTQPTPTVDLNGQWTSGQYQCPFGQYYTETVQINQQGQQISAVKITGDPCVPVGYKSFEGSLFGNSAQLTCFGGFPQTPASASSPGTLRVIDAYTFEACSMQFVRSGAAPSLGVGSPQTGAWQGSPTYGSPAPWQQPITPQQPYPYTPPWQSPVAPATRAPSAQLQPPTYSGDDANQRYIFRVNGQLNDAYRLQAQLVFYFQYLHRPTQTWTDLQAKTGSQYSATTGNIALYTNLSVAFNPYDLGGLSLQIPYSELNMKGPDFPWQRGEKYRMRAWAEVRVNGTSVGSSTPVYFDYAQNDP